MVKTVRTLAKHYIGPPPPPEEPEIQELRVLPESAEHNLLGKKIHLCFKRVLSSLAAFLDQF